MAKGHCSVDGCDRAHQARGLCKAHYNQWHRANRPPEQVCGIDGCDRPAHARGWCKAHHKRWMRHGDPTTVVREQGPDWGNPPCGTNAGYRAGCRCEDCTAATREYGRGWRDANRERWRESVKRGNRKRRAALRGAESEPYTTAEIADRDGWRCGLCGQRIGRTLKHPHPRSLSIDHIVPLSRGGSDLRDNIQAAHLVCNTAKNNRGDGDQLLLFG